MLLKIWLWLVRSSADPEQLSATIKGLAGFVPSLVILLTVIHLNVDADTLLAIIDRLAILVSALAGIVTAVYTAWGFTRKVWTTITGTNQVVLGFARED